MSNLPTVWTNALAGAIIGAGTSISNGAVIGAAVILSLFYVGGMWLNDAFDAEIDARERASRPIPSGEISQTAVFLVGAALLVFAVLLGSYFGSTAAAAALALAAAILLYDWLHKRTALSTLIMGATRFLCYVFGALVAGGFSAAVLIGAAGLFAYVVGLTYAAKQEAYDRIGRAWPLAVLAVPPIIGLVFAGTNPVALSLWAALVVLMSFAVRLLFKRKPGDVPRAVVTLIAGISLYDAVLIAGQGFAGVALVAVGAFLLTLFFQRFVPGT
ncbi:UbiA family prenyltransferase [Loktanella sp. DJP18]|uniref:UbiA family prenyltransferase n=1 Tax=Loktanella sp. DJP18 TaxID=3409788 RepID=UPI003BB60B74